MAIDHDLVETRGRPLEEMSRLFGVEGRIAGQGGIDSTKGDNEDTEPLLG